MRELTRVVRYNNLGGIDDLWIDDVSTPEALPGHVIVRVIALCINPGSVSALNGALRRGNGSCI